MPLPKVECMWVHTDMLQKQLNDDFPLIHFFACLLTILLKSAQKEQISEGANRECVKIERG